MNTDGVAGRAARDATRVAAEASDHPALSWSARVGLAVNGLLHLLVAWIAFRVAVGSTGHNADQSGALRTLAAEPGGQLVLWIGAVGFLALALWEVADGFRDWRRNRDTGWVDLARDAATAIVHLAVGLACLRFALGSSSSSKQHSQELTATLMQQPGGRVLVGAVGLVVIGVGVYHGWKGVTRRFLEELRGEPNPVSTTAGVVGYLAKGIALALVGGLFLAAAVHHRPQQAGGLDSALRTLQSEPYGVVLLGAVAAGLAAYGVYALTTAHRRV